MNTTTKNILIGVLIAIVVILLARFVFFKEQIDEWGRGLERVGEWQEQYMRDHPDATEEQMDAAFNTGIANIEVWQAQYKKDNPDATKAEMDAAFEAMWE